MKLVCNKISNRSNCNLCRQSSEEELTDAGKEKIDYQIPKKLRYNNYSYVLPSSESFINDTINRMKNELDHKLISNTPNKKMNLTRDEGQGLKWLQTKISEGKIAVTKADKGGATLIVYTELLKRKSLEKLEDTNLYEKLNEDPSKKLHSDLIKTWIGGKKQTLLLLSRPRL